ncbi:thaumatin [Mycena sanguinolenta]|nr:thaumatin [Mycena sanguinolenta]
MVSGAVADRIITVTNACPLVIWPAFFSSSGRQPEQTPGWEAQPNTDFTFSTPENWVNGELTIHSILCFRGRRNCDFSTSSGPNSCLDGGCNGGLVCNITTGTGIPPATLDFSGESQDIYTVSVVDGYNLPYVFRTERFHIVIHSPRMAITNNCACSFASCPVDLAISCPLDLAGPLDSASVPVGCNSACLVDALAGHSANSSNCCTGSFDSESACPSSGVEHYSYFKTNCPNSFVYACDESSGTAIWQCEKSCMFEVEVEYGVTFCPEAAGVSNL